MREAFLESVELFVSLSKVILARLRQAGAGDYCYPFQRRYKCNPNNHTDMFPSRAQCAKRNLLLCFDAFGTLFQPNTPIPRAYAQAALNHDVKITAKNPEADVGREFKRAFKEASARNPNYGKATGLGAEKWWRNVS